MVDENLESGIDSGSTTKAKRQSGSQAMCILVVPPSLVALIERTEKDPPTNPVLGGKTLLVGGSLVRL